jgi:hypothetical protein
MKHQQKYGIIYFRKHYDSSIVAVSVSQNKFQIISYVTLGTIPKAFLLSESKNENKRNNLASHILTDHNGSKFDSANRKYYITKN